MTRKHREIHKNSRINARASAVAAKGRKAAEVPPSNKKKYKIREEVGQGGMGVVFRATRLSDNRDIALKLIKPEFLRQQKTMVRFQREIRALVRLKHENLVSIYDYRLSADSKPYLAMEFVDGSDLYNLVQEKGALKHGEIVRIGCELASAVQYIHSHNMIHRDLKPRNILLTKEGKVKVSDFGLSKQLDLTPITELGVQVGTPRYMAPEVVKGGMVDHRSDIYQLGLLLYYMSTGEVAHRGKSVVEVMKYIVAGDILLPSTVNQDIHPILEGIILKCLQRDPEKRYRHAGILQEALMDFDKQHRDSGYVFVGRDKVGITAVTSSTLSSSGEMDNSCGSSSSAGEDREKARASRSRLAKILLPVFVILVVITVILSISSGFTDLNEGQQNLKMSIKASEGTARINWVSEVPCVSRIVYTLKGSAVEGQSGTFQGPEVKNHEILLENLESGSDYSFQVLFADDSKSRAYHFTTKTKEAQVPAISEAEMAELDTRIKLEFQNILSSDSLIFDGASEYLLNLRGKHIESAVVPFLKDKNRIARAMAISVLSKTSGRDGLKLVAPLLEDPFEEVTAKVVRFFKDYGKSEDLELVIPYLNHTMSRCRIAALKAVAAIGGAKSLSLIFSMIRDEDFRVKISAIHLMGRKDGGQYAPLLIQQMEKERTIIGIAAYLNSLGIIGDPQASITIRKYLGSPDILIMVEAMTALARVDGERALAILERFLSSKNETVALAAVDALGEINSVKAVFVLKQFSLNAQEKGLRRAIRAIGRIRKKEAETFIEQSLTNENVLVRADAMLALAEQHLVSRIPFFKKMLTADQPVLQISAMLALAELKVFEAEEQIRNIGKNSENPVLSSAADHCIMLLHDRSLLAINIRCTTVTIDGTIVTGRIANE